MPATSASKGFVQVSRPRWFGGVQAVFRHRSVETGTDMRFSAYLAPQAEADHLPVVLVACGTALAVGTVFRSGWTRLQRRGPATAAAD